VLVLACLPGCGEDSGPTDPPGGGNNDPPSGEAVPDFSLQDVNPTSSTYDQAVSPRDYLEQVSAWYFGSAT
jgi:hypothetical protein